MYSKWVIVSLAWGLCGPALADEIADQVRAIPAGVEDVSIGGSWQDGERAGAYRLVVVRSDERVTARLFLQWIAYADAGGTTLLDSIEIREFADLGVDILSLSSEADDDGLTVFVETIGDFGEIGDTYELHVFSPANYRFGPTTN